MPRKPVKLRKQHYTGGGARVADPQMRLAVELADVNDIRRALALHITPDQVRLIRTGH